MTKKHLIFVGVTTILVAVLYSMYGGSTVPSGQPPLLRLSDSNLWLLKDAFNQSAHQVRLLLLLSPT